MGGYPSLSVTETLISAIEAVGGPVPTSFGLGELLKDFDNALADFNPGGGVGTNVVRTASVTANPFETSILSGTATGQEITLATPSGFALNTVKNFATERWLVGPGVLGPGSAFGIIALVPGDSVTLAFVPGTGWYPVMTQQGQSQGVYNLLSWGADPTGSSASDAEIQAAHDQCAASRAGFLYTPPGATFKINNPITMGNAQVFKTRTTAGSSGTTLNATNPIAAGFPTASVGSPKHLMVWVVGNTTSFLVTYTGMTTSAFTGVSSLSGITASNLLVTAGVVSTQNNVVLLGPSLGSHTRFGALAYGGPPGASWIAGSGFPAGENMVQFNGPMSGGGVENMYFDCNSIAGGAYQLIGHQAGVFKNNTAQDYTNNAYWYTSTATFYDEVGGIGVTPLTAFYDIENCGGYSAATGANLTLHYCACDEADLGSMTNNMSYGTIKGTQGTLQDPGTGFLSAGFYMRGCDNVAVFGGNFIASPGSSGLVFPIVMDYTVAGVPESCLFDGINPGQGYADPVLFTGTVADSPSPNIFTNIRGGATFPSRLTGQYVAANQWLSDAVHGNY